MSIVSRQFGWLIPCGTILCPTVGNAQTFQTLYSFAGGTDGSAPMAGVTIYYQGKGNLVLFGTTCGYLQCFGDNGYGTIFMYDPSSGKLTTLYTFTGGTDGGNPFGKLVLKGDYLYGTTSDGGDLNCNLTGTVPGCGTLFQFNISTNQLTTLHSFANNGDGEGPLAPVLFDKGSKIYGTTTGGNQSYGTIFELNLKSEKFKTLYSFYSLPNDADGAYPGPGGLVLGNDGTLYGTTTSGGAYDGGNPNYGGGTVFTIDPRNGKLTTLHSFGVPDSQGKIVDGGGSAGVSFDGTELYGSARNGGLVGAGSLFELNPTTRQYYILYSFCVGGGEYNCAAFGSAYPNSSLTLYGGSFYGTTLGAGSYGQVGSVFQFDPANKSFTTLYDFGYSGSAGALPNGPIAFDKKGNLYSTTQMGGCQGSCYGTIFELQP